MPMTRINDAINRRTALVQLTAATVLAVSAAKAQRPDPSLAQIRTTDLGRKTYMPEGQGGNILVVIGDDGIIMVAPELAPLHDKIKVAITENSSLPIKYLVDTRFHGEQTGGNAPFHRDGAIVVAQDNVRVRLLAGTTNGLNYNKSPSAHPDAIPTETYVGGTKTVAVRGREALLTHATNAHTDGDSWIYLADANVIFTGDLLAAMRSRAVASMSRNSATCALPATAPPRLEAIFVSAVASLRKASLARTMPRCQMGRQRAGLGQLHPDGLQLVQAVVTAMIKDVARRHSK